MMTCYVNRSWGRFIPLLVVELATLISSIYGDPTNLFVNGNFEANGNLILFNWPQFDVIHDGDMNYIQQWQCVHGGVQILDSTNEYNPDPRYVSSFLIHLNYKYGRGVLLSDPLATPRKGAPYNLTFSFADNPDGGPMFKSFRVKLLVNGEIAEPVIPDFSISSPESQRDTIPWMTGAAMFVGTGETTTVQFESLVDGSFGPLIDNVKTTLLGVLDNGSFEKTRTLMLVNNNTWFDTITGPSNVITSWTVVSGAIKRAGGGKWESSTDGSPFCLDLNANETSGRIVSDPFPTVPGANYVLLYDTAASPNGNVQAVYGDIYAAVKVSMDGFIVNSHSVLVNADGFSEISIGWTTQTLPFKARNLTHVLEFVSKIAGSNGPLLDNVYVYQVLPTKKYKSLPLTYDAAGKLSPRTSMWITLLAGGLAIFMTAR